MKKIELEFPIHASPSFIYQYVSTPDSLGEWFADNVNSRGQNFTFIWDDSEETAKRVAQRTDQFVRFKWIDADDEDAFFEFRIQVDALTKDVSLIITDFAEDDEEEELKMFWENKISDLKHAIGG
ncbi:MAG: START-like domain-containing protein [Lutimonas sp.]|jgi:uncharacterized protein YndB with AHSA1/START domain